MNDENMTITVIKAFRTTLGERNKDDPDQAIAPDLEHTNQDIPLKRAPLPDRSSFDEPYRTPVDFLVLGQHGRSVLDEQFPGSVSPNPVHNAQCDVSLTP